jgi:hypothetical protein
VFGFLVSRLSMKMAGFCSQPYLGVILQPELKGRHYYVRLEYTQIFIMFEVSCLHVKFPWITPYKFARMVVSTSVSVKCSSLFC